MRGKILSYVLLAIILGTVMLAGTASAVASTQIRVEPSLVSGLLPGDTFSVDIMVSRVENLYAWGFSLGYSPMRLVLDCIDVSGQKDFLGKTGLSVYAPIPRVDLPVGAVYVSATLVGAVPPGKEVSGDGKLATITFKVVEAGECALDLYGTTLFEAVSGLPEIPHLVKDGYYRGPKAELINKFLPLGRVVNLTERNYQTFLSSVKSKAVVPLYVKVKFHMVRDDGKIIDLSTNVKQLYVDGFTDTRPLPKWNYVGTTPFLNAVDDGKYIWHPAIGPGTPGSTRWGRYAGDFSFENTIIPAGRTIVSVTLDFYVKGYDRLAYYVWNGATWSSVAYLTPEIYYEWTSAAVTTILNTPAKVDAAKVYVRYNSYAASPSIPRGGEMYVDAARLSVTLSPQIVQPDEELEMDSITWSGLTTADIGTYTCEAMCYYSYTGAVFNKGLKTSTFKWWVIP